jgi:hypothetical protein
MQKHRYICRTKKVRETREIFAAMKGGQSVESVTIRYVLKPASVSTIIRTEKHLRAVYPDLIYRVLRAEET